MRPIDPFYTPHEIAVKMVSYASNESKRFIADFAAGGGELLKTASLRWPESKFIATDICKNAVKSLRQNYPNWLVGRCDFQNPQSINKCNCLYDKKEKISLILLNPPFSCRGGSYTTVCIKGNEIKCSPALAFFLISIDFLSPNGQIIAILPAGSIQSQRDKPALNLLKQIGKLDVIATNGNRTFIGCSSTTVITSFMKFDRSQHVKLINKLTSQKSTKKLQNLDFEIFRGRIQMPVFEKQKVVKGLPFVHTTELKENGIILNRYKISNKTPGISGPAVLLPRVGKPNKKKINLYNDSSTIVISDCIIAILCKSRRRAKSIKILLWKNWTLLRECYSGTCAKYITVELLTNLLRGLILKIENK